MHACKSMWMIVQMNEKLQVCRGLDPEEPVQSAARLCCFRDLEVTVCPVTTTTLLVTAPALPHCNAAEFQMLEDAARQQTLLGNQAAPGNLRLISRHL